MPRRALPPVARIVWLSALAAVVLFLVREVAAQQEFGNHSEIEKAKRENEARFEELIKGEKQPGPDDQAALDAFAQYFVYLVAHPRIHLQKGRAKNITDELARRVKEYAEPDSPYYAKNRKFMEQWTDRLIVALGQVMKSLEVRSNENRVSLVHVAMLLPVYAKAKQEKFGDFLGSVLADEKQHDVMKLYAVKALRAYLPARPSRTSDDPDDKRLHDTIARDTRRVKSALDFVERKWDTLDAPVARYIRREALQTLAESQVPAMKVRGGKVELPVAQALLRTLSAGKEGLNPPPSLAEKVEAAIGVCRMKAKLIEDYQPEAGIYLVGRFLVEFITKYREDYTRFGGKKEKGAAKVLPALPWKKEADRLEKALKELDTNLMAGTPTHKKALDLASAARIALGGMKSHLPVDVRELELVLPKLQPGREGGRIPLFKGVKGIEVDLSVQQAAE